VVWATGRSTSQLEGLQLHDRVLLQPWVAQKALLHHPAVAAFMSHGGIESAHEAMGAALPMVVMCVSADQCTNAGKLKDLGMAMAVTKRDVRAGQLGAALASVLADSDGSYRAAAAKMRAMAAVAGRGAADRAADVLEFAAHYGWRHLEPPAARMSWVRASNADVWAAVLVVVVGTLAGAGYASKLCLLHAKGLLTGRPSKHKAA